VPPAPVSCQPEAEGDVDYPPFIDLDDPIFAAQRDDTIFVS